MIDTLKDFYDAVSIIDLIYLVINILSLITCYKKGFVLSILSMAKWFLAYVLTLLIFPKIKPYLKDIIDNEYVLDIGLGLAIFVVVIFSVLTIYLIIHDISFKEKKYTVNNFESLKFLTKMAFNKRRKSIKNSLKDVKNISIFLKELGIKDNLRPEQISVEQFCKLANLIYKSKK